MLAFEDAQWFQCNLIFMHTHVKIDDFRQRGRLAVQIVRNIR
jgi:hypothetical protein